MESEQIKRMANNIPCPFCHEAEDGTVSCWHMDATVECDVESAEIYVDDGVTVILRTPKFPQDQRLHIDTNYCPMCGRRYKSDEREAD